MSLFFHPLVRSVLPLSVALALRCAPGQEAAPAVVRIPVGEARLETADTELDRKVGAAFVPGLRTGANTCYVEALRNDPEQRGAIDFVVRPPAEEGRFAVELHRRGSIGTPLVACVDRLFGTFRHYKDKMQFDRIAGTFRFEPRWISAPVPPTDAIARAALAEIYSPSDVVEVTRMTPGSITEYVAATSSQVLRSYHYRIELRFRSDGYEATCRHDAVYKVFAKRPYDASQFAGHTCESRRRKAGEAVSDDATVVFRLPYEPEVADRWVVVRR